MGKYIGDNERLVSGKVDLNKIYCMKALDFLGCLPDKFLGLTFTSPPYNLSNTTGGGMIAAGSKWPRPQIQKGYAGFNDNMPMKEYEMWQMEIIRELWRATRDDGVIFYNHKCRSRAKELWTPLVCIPPDIPIRQIIIWQRAGGFMYNKAFYVPAHEWIIMLAKPDFVLKDQPSSGATDVWFAAQEANTPHPAPFPIKLPTIAIETTDLGPVCDPFMGWGTTALAAQNLNKAWIGSDVGYITLAERRLLGASKKTPASQILFDLGGQQ